MVFSAGAQVQETLLLLRAALNTLMLPINQQLIKNRNLSDGNLLESVRHQRSQLVLQPAQRFQDLLHKRLRQLSAKMAAHLRKSSSTQQQLSNTPNRIFVLNVSDVLAGHC
jgi:hypothetical protein